MRNAADYSAGVHADQHRVVFHFVLRFRLQDTSRKEVVKLQGGDPESLKCWKMLLEQSDAASSQIYTTLDVDGLVLRGESFYNPMLQVGR